MSLPPIEYTNITFRNECSAGIIIKDSNRRYYRYDILFISNDFPLRPSHLLDITLYKASKHGTGSLHMGLFGCKIGILGYNFDDVEIFIDSRYKIEIESMLHESLRKIINV